MLKTWEELEVACNNCTSCELCKTRHNVVFGRGNKDAKVLLVGEGPGYHEDMEGKPFVGQAGNLLDLVLCALEISQQDIYIANIVKCRPPENRAPYKEEVASCIRYLRNQVYLQNPKIIVCLGSIATKYILREDVQISKIRGTWVRKKDVLIMPTYHPAALLRDVSKKIPLWEDLKEVRLKMRELC